jgi:hypothetical protein
MAVGIGGAAPRALVNVFVGVAPAAPGAVASAMSIGCAAFTARVWPAALAAFVLAGLATIPTAAVAVQAETKLPAFQISSKVLLQRYAVENVACRGGSGDQTETWEHCGKRDYIAELLGYIGITP